MKRYSRIFKYIAQYKGEVFWYCFFILFSILFSIISLGMLMPFLDLIFKDASITPKSTNPVVGTLEGLLKTMVNTNNKVEALGVVCIIIISSIFLKNLFLVFSNYILNPLKNKVVNQLRTELYNKILHLPIGYFTEQKKGDLISRITNDVSEVESSVVSALEGWIRDPLMIIFNFTVLFLISPQLTGFLLFFIPVVGFIIGRNTLFSKGLKPMDAKGKEFNADVHEAITEIEAGEEMQGKVVDEVIKGYYLNEKIIRFAKVVVGK